MTKGADKNKIMIRVRDAEKVYRLGMLGGGTLREDLESWWAKKHGKADPNGKIRPGTRIEGEYLHALRGVSLTVRAGECCGLIGSNGSGKSTLLKLIAQVTAPTKGSIDLYGRVTSMLEVGTGFHGEMTGLENIYLNGSILGMSRREIDDVLEEIIEFSEIREFINTPVKRYSSGMYVKLAFSVASHLRSEIMLMDEVLAVGDLAFQRKCIDRMLHAAKEENRAVLFVSHNMSTVRALCDRCAVMDEGKIIIDGDVEEAIRMYSTKMREKALDGGRPAAQIRRDRNLSGLVSVADVSPLRDVTESGGMIRFAVRLSAKAPVSGARIRLVVKNELGEIAGMSYSGPEDVPQGESVRQCAFSTGPLAPGRYVCDMAVFDYTGGVQIRHDFIREVLYFTVEDDTDWFGVPWKASAWGNTVLPGISFEEGGDA